MKAKCKRCGKCCIIKEIGGEWKPCKYLIKYVDGTTRCSIYMHRVGAIVGGRLGGIVVCVQREKLPYNIPGCPYNKKGLNIHPAYK